MTPLEAVVYRYRIALRVFSRGENGPIVVFRLMGRNGGYGLRCPLARISADAEKTRPHGVGRFWPAAFPR